MSLNARNLSCERNGRVVFEGLNFSIQTGECAEVRGNNGAGKSSLLRLLAGLVPTSAGEVVFNGETDFAQQLHLIAHQDAVKSAMTVAENLEFWCAVLGGRTIDKALAAFQLDNLKYEPAQLLSAGQRRRLALSRLFLCHRPLWLLDEPMTALDVDSQDVLRQHITSHLFNKGLLLIATHGEFGIVPQHTLTLGGA